MNYKFKLFQMDDKPLADKLRMQEKEKLLIERTLSQLLTQSNIKLPPDVRVSCIVIWIPDH